MGYFNREEIKKLDRKNLRELVLAVLALLAVLGLVQLLA